MTTTIFEDEEKCHISIWKEGMPLGFGPKKDHVEVVPFTTGPLDFLSKPWELKKKKLTVVHGRFQPFHNGHKNFIDKAIVDGDATLVIVCSAGESPSQQNPLTAKERTSILEAVYGDIVNLATLNDYKYDDDTWYEEAIEIMKTHAGDEYDIVLKAAIKPGDTATEACYKGFEERGINVEYIEISDVINATDIRNKLFCGYITWGDISVMVPKETYAYLLAWTSSEKSPMKSIEAEYKAVKDYKASWAGSPFPPVFVAVDGLCVWYDRWNKPHILIIERKSEVGNGKLAMPGGFLDVNESVFDSAKREVMEETTLDVSDWMLKSVDMFDSPRRSLRGRMITHVHVFEKRSERRPIVEGQDDAGKAFWLPIDEVSSLRHRFFSDHFHIIAKLLPEVHEY